jgi:putative ABC transport system permease protein
MHRVRSFWIRILNLFRRSKLETDLREQLETHREMIESDLIRRGMEPSQAEASSRRAMGNDAFVRQLSREEMVHRVLAEMSQDIRHGLRALARNPGFTVVATASLAIGIGANAFIFSLINSTLLNSLGYPASDRLAVIWTVQAQNPNQTTTSSVSTYFGLRDANQSFEALGAFNGGACGIRSLGSDRDGSPAERIYGQCFTPSLFGILGTKPVLGRTFTDEEDQTGKVAPVVLISYALWQQRFGADPAVVGKTVLLNQVATTIIGVLPADFRLFRDPNVPVASRSPQIDFVAPLELGPTQVNSRIGGNTIVGRLKSGVSLNQAHAEIAAIASQMAAENPSIHEGLSVRADPLQRVAHRDYRSPLLLLQGAVGFVLLISCANVAGLLLARMATRRGEVGLRIALGASRRRVIRQLVTESFPLALIGGAIGVLASYAGLSLFITMAPADFPRLDHAALDLRVVGFTLAVVVATCALFAGLPAIHAATSRLGGPLKEFTRSATGGAQRQRLRILLVTAQIALALVLLIGAGLMINSFIRIVKADLGADPTDLLTFDFHLPPAETIKVFSMYRSMGLAVVSPKPALTVENVLQRLQSLPGVVSVAAVSSPPFGSRPVLLPFLIEGRTPDLQTGGAGATTGPSPETAEYLAVTHGYLSLMKIAIVKGRDFDAHDTSDGHLVTIINETMARRYFSNEDPIGKRITFDFVPDEQPREIVGVVRDVTSDPMQPGRAPVIYVPHLQQASQWIAPYWGMRSGMYFLIRSHGRPSGLISAVKAAVAEVDRNTPAAGISTVEQILSNQTRTLRAYMLLLGIFAAVAALLAATGIYGVIAYSVAERTKEIGIRMALGGRAPDILIMVLRQAGWIVAVGLTVGLLSTFVLSRLIQSMLVGITATDPMTYVAVSLLLVLISTIACLIPARRAATVDPVLALKHD